MTSEGICERCHQPVPANWLIRIVGGIDAGSKDGDQCPDTLPDFRDADDIERIFSAQDEAESELLGEEDRLFGEEDDSDRFDDLEEEAS